MLNNINVSKIENRNEKFNFLKIRKKINKNKNIKINSTTKIEKLPKILNNKDGKRTAQKGNGRFFKLLIFVSNELLKFNEDKASV